MKFCKYFAATSILAASAVIAHATPITGTVVLSGNEYFNISNNVETVTGFGSNQVKTTGTGSFTGLTSGLYLSLNGFTTGASTGTEFSWSQPSTPYPQFVFTLTAPVVDVAGAFTLDGTLVETANGATLGTSSYELTISAPGASGGLVTETLGPAGGTNPAASITPEPASLLLLGTGLVGGVGAMMRSRRSA